MPELAPPPDTAPVLAQQFKVQDDCSLQVTVPRSRVRLRPATAPDRVSVDITVAGTDAVSDETIIERLDIGTRQVKETIRIASGAPSQDPDWWRWMRETEAVVFLDVRVPSPVEASLHLPGGTLALSALRGAVDASVTGGAIRIDRFTGPLSLTGRRSPIHVSEAEGPSLTIESAGAPVTITDGQSDRVDVTSVSGPLAIENARGACTVSAHASPVTLTNLTGTCQATAHGGSLTFASSLPAPATLTTVGAPLTAELAASTEATLEATGAPVTIGASLPFDGEQTDSHLHGTLNGGGPALSLQAIRGRVHCDVA
ncbi:MAG: hypothetical protein R6T83_06860 [Salinibacter sp.]